jgi:hypothetical protein
MVCPHGPFSGCDSPPLLPISPFYGVVIPSPHTLFRHPLLCLVIKGVALGFYGRPLTPCRPLACIRLGQILE